MTDSGCGAAGFEDLLLEAWELCTDDETVRASDEYKCARQWLSKLTMSGRRGPSDVQQLNELVCTLRAAARGQCSGKAAADCRPSTSSSSPQSPSPDSCEHDECAPRPPARMARKPPVNEKLVAALAVAQDQCMDMRRFFREVAAYTCDGGELLMRVTGDVVSDFRSFVDTVFGNRVSQIGMVLAREQMTLHDRYAELECRTMNRAQLVLARVRDVMPTFDWNRYASNPGYIRSMVVSRCVDSAQDRDSDGENAKGLLYQLNWLRSEIDRTECENHGLHAQLTALTAELSEINGKILAARCRAEAEQQRLTCELGKLRSKAAVQANTVDKLMETIQISIENSKADSVVPTAACNS